MSTLGSGQRDDGSIGSAVPAGGVPPGFVRLLEPCPPMCLHAADGRSCPPGPRHRQPDL